MKYAVRILALLAVFVGAILFFGSNMDEVMFRNEKSVDMSESILPTVSTYSDGVELNCLYGYTSPIDMYAVRENFVAVEKEQVVELLITQNETDVRRLSYRICDVATREEIASGDINAFDKTDGKKKARIKVEPAMEQGQEYAVEITLINSESRRIYYYFRMKYYEDSHLAEKIQFIENFSANARAKDHQAVIPYLESTYRGEGFTYAYVDIYDSYYMVCWGNLQPELLTKPQLKLSELYSNVAVATLTYMAELDTGSGKEQYYVMEKFRVIVTSTATHLLNYERTLEAVFRPELASISQKQLKVGLTNDTGMEFFTNSDSSMIGFVRNNELWHYNMAENRISKVFSLRHDNEAKEGMSFDDHEVRILNLYENGDISFMVFGYMNRGQYEGKTGILLYRYHRAENRVEEQLYIPVSASYQKLEQGLGEFSYMNAYDVFFFTAYQKLYSYNITTKEFKVISEGVQELVFSGPDSYVAWQENYDRIFVLHLEENRIREITAPEGEFVRLYGKIDENMIYGYGRRSDMALTPTGEQLYPAYLVQIVSSAEEVKREYREEGIYIADVTLEGKTVCMRQIVKYLDEYRETGEDYRIMNRENVVSGTVYLDKRISELMMAEYYIDLPSAYSMKEAPEEVKVPFMVIQTDTTVRIEELEEIHEVYYVYSFGGVILTTTDVAEAVLLADEPTVVGTVVNEAGRVVWERGIKYNADYVSSLTEVSCKGTALDGHQALVQMMAAHKGYELDGGEFTHQISIKDFLEEKTGERVLTLTGITLDEALYYVYKNEPVFVMRNADDAVLLRSYTAGNVTFFNPRTGRDQTYTKDEAEEMFTDAGSVYISFLP